MKRNRKLLAMILALCLCLPILAACGKTIKYSEGLNFTLNIDRNSYSVKGIGTCTDTDIYIPPVYNELPVTRIDDMAFEDYLNLTSITIPDSVTRIGSRAFSNCLCLTSITIPDSVTSIGDRAFGGCTSLMALHISDVAAWCNVNFTDYSANPLYYAKNLYLNGNLVTDLVIPDSVTSISNSAFSGCTSIESITIGNSVTSIGYEAFRNCTSIESITIPDSVTSIGGGAFYGCTGITSITIPDSVTSIGYEAFRNCTSIESITIPDSVTSIGSSTFDNCTSLTSITIPDSVTSIGNYAFFGCTSLTSIMFNGTKRQWTKISKDYNWNHNTGKYTVYCTDGNKSK